MSRFEGKVALVTGAARGQGQCDALAMAEEGADIIAVDVAAADGSSLLGETAALVEGLGRRIIACTGDVRSLASLEEAVGKGVSELGRLDYVIANAAVTVRGGVFDFTEDQWSRVLEVNLRGAWATCKAASPHLGRGASIVLIGSTSALRPAPGYLPYTTSKHGLIGLMRTMMLELAPLGIRVNTVHPGLVDTPMLHNPEMYKLFTGREDATREEIAAILTPGNPMGVPWVDARDVANAVIFLCSDEARYINGASITVDAGASN